MSITNEERRRFAARLRDFESYRNAFKESPVCGMLDIMDKKGYLGWQKLCERLADYIEPEPERTCRNVHKSKDSGCFECSMCGSNALGYNWQSFHIELEWNFCPNCGAKVIE